MGTTFIIAKREFRSNFDSPLAYVVICIGLLLVGFLFFSWWNGGFWQADRTSLAGLFALAPWLLLVVASVVRYLQGHGLGDQAEVVLPGAAILLIAYAAGRRLTGTAAVVWLVAVVACWTVLALIAPSFSWAAVPLVFLALRVLPFRWAVAPLFAPVGAAFLRALPPALALLGLHYLWVVRAQASFEDAAIAQARKRA